MYNPFDRPCPNQFEMEYIGNNLAKVSVYDGSTGRMLYSVTIDHNEAEDLCNEFKAKGYVRRGEAGSIYEEWSFWD